jgi:DNA-binding transcriptional MocR family regulator
VELPETMNARDLMKDCIDHKVAFVPGDSFFPTSGKKNYFRLNFSNCDDERLEEGIQRIADVIKRHM